MAEAANPPELPDAAGAREVAAASPSNDIVNAASVAAGGRYNKELSNAFKLLQEMATLKSKCNWKLSSSKKVISPPFDNAHFYAHSNAAAHT